MHRLLLHVLYKDDMLSSVGILVARTMSNMAFDVCIQQPYYYCCHTFHL